MINNYRISIGKNLAGLFINQEKYCLEKFKWFREELSSHLNCEIKPIHISDDERLKDDVVLLINTKDENIQYVLNFDNNLEDELLLFLVKLMYLYEEIYKQEYKSND